MLIDRVRFVKRISVFLILLPASFLCSCGGSSWFVRSNRPPVADAGPDFAVYQGRPFQLDGSRSADPDGVIASYRWVQTDGKSAGDFDRTGIRTEVVAPFVSHEGGELQFRLTVTDDGGLSATDSVSIKVNKYLFFDDFRLDTIKDYAARDVRQDGSTGQFRYIEALNSVHAIPGPDSGLKFSHDLPASDNGTFSFVFTPSRFQHREGRVRVFLMEDNDNYYEVFNGNNQGSGGLRKVVNGREVDNIRMKYGYSSNVPYPVSIVFSPETTLLDAPNELAVMKRDHEGILVNRFEILTEGQEAYFDNIVLTQDPFLKAMILNRVGLWDSNVTVKAIPGALRKGWKIRFILDQHTRNQAVAEDQEEPFQATFQKVSLSPHTVDAYLVDETGTEILAHDRVNYTARDDYYVAVGDSITAGTGDDSLSMDGNGRPGYEPVLENLLESAKGYPHKVVIQGNGGDASADGLKLMPTVLAIHPEANYFLILYGTNDSSIPVPSGRGLQPGDPGYRGSFKDNMQQMISLIIADGKTPIPAKVPVVFGSNGGKHRYRNPDRNPRNLLIKEYNIVIDELIAANNVPVSPPDFYSYFRKHPREFSDGVHPNGRGYRSMAKLWLRVLTKTEKSTISREPLTKKEAEPILLEKPSPAAKEPEHTALSRPPQVENYVIQVAAFRNPEYAKKLRNQLLQDGYKAFLERNGKFHKVVVGPYPDKHAANQAIRKLKAERKLDPFLVRR